MCYFSTLLPILLPKDYQTEGSVLDLWVCSYRWANLGRCGTTKARTVGWWGEAASPTLRGVPRVLRWRGALSRESSFVWLAFHGIDGGVGFYPLTDVAAAVSATPTQNPGKAAT